MTGPRVIIESRHTAAADALASALVEAGLDPLVCSGPGGSAGCPILDGAPCALLDGAAAVVFDLDLGRADHRLVLQSLVTEHEGLPIITERSSEEVRRHGGDLKECTVVVPFSPRHTAEAVAGAVIAAERVPTG